MTGEIIPAAYRRFQGRYGGRPDGQWTAPGRVNLIGEHTDYSGGFVLPIAIDRRTGVTARSRDDGVFRVSSAQLGDAPAVVVADLEPGPMAGWWAYAHGMAWALRELGVSPLGADVLIDTDVPLGAGLSSSAALEVAVGRALADLAGALVEPAALAMCAQRAERTWTGTPCGVMDQMASSCARAGHALLIDTLSLDIEHVPFDLEARGLEIAVVDTRVRHAHAGGEYPRRVEQCAAAAAVLGVERLREATPESVDAAADRLGELLHRRARHVVTENARVLEAATIMRQGSLEDIGPLLAASHASLRDDFEVSVAELDTAVAAALAAGALAARMTGGGFGGSAIALVEAGRATALAASVRDAFEEAGFRVPEVFTAGPAGGARRQW